MAFNSKYSAKKYLNADELNNSRSNENDRKSDEKADAASLSSSDNDEDTGVNFIKEGEKRVSELNAFINSQKDLYRKMHSQTKSDQNLYKDDDDNDEEEDEDNDDDDEDATEGDELELEAEDRHRLINKQSSGSTIVNAADNEEEEEEEDDDRQQLLKEFKENLKFKKYLNDLKKSYLDNLSLSCPSKISIKSGSQTSMTNSNRSSQGAKRKILFENLASNITQEMSINRSNGTEDDDYEDEDDDEKVSLSLRDNLVRKSTDDAGSKEMLSTEQILSRLQQIREYLKQAYSMLGTLESSNELANYSPQMNKLHSLIEHLKDQEKGYMDLLNSLRLYEKLSKDEKQRHTSVTSKTSANSTLVSETESKKASKKRREESLSLSGSLISDTITLEAEAKKQRKVKSDIDEQERLLKSINQRREELRALEGRRKALEALKLEAIANEKDLMAKVDSKMKATSSNSNTMAAQKMKLENFQKRFTELAASATDALPKSEIKDIGDELPAAMEPLSAEDKILLQDRLNDLQAKKQAVDQLLVDLNKLKQGSGGSGGDSRSSGADVKGSVVVKNVVKKELDEQDEKMKTLIENQAKLDKLYAMQTRLDQLKSIVGHFHDEKNLDSILSNYEAKLNDNDNDEEINEDADDEDLKQISGYKDLYMKKLRRERYVEAKEPQQQQKQQQTMMLDELKAQSQKQLNDHKKKLNNAKEKLRQLQGLISTIQNVDDDENIDDKDDDDDDDEVDDDDNEDFGGLMSGSGRDDEYKQQNVVRNWSQHNHHDAALDLSLSSEKQRNVHENSSDALWAQMKQQLKMRDKLRGKKKELEDVIRNECSDFKARNNKGKTTSSVVAGGANEISLGDESRLSSVSSRRPKLQQQQQQENLDDLISLSNYDYEANNASVFNASINGLKKQLHESSETFGCMIDNQKKLTSLLERNLVALSQNQSQSQSQIHSSCNSDVGSFVHLQNQMQIQQLVFNLNAAYREIALQRNEINQLTSQMNQLNAHLFTNTNSNKSSQITTGDKIESPEKKQHQQDDSATIHTYVDDFEPESSGAQQQQNSKQSSKVSKSVNAATQRAVSTTSSSSSSSNDSNGNTNMLLLEKNSEYLLKRLNQSRNNMMHHNSNNNKNSTSSSSVTSCGKAKSAPATTSNSSTTFDQLRESIYSEVATLISQNETRPQYLLNLFRELQHLQTKNSRDQALKSIFNISSRQSTLVQSQDESIKVSKIDDEATAPFANDALGDTVIYLHMSESAKPKSTIKNTTENLNLNNSKSFNNMLYTCSSNSSVVSVREKNLSEYHISHDVPLIVERAMAMLKYDKESVFDESMMKMLIYKIVMVLRQQKQHLDYLRLYENQLSSYLAEALSNYLQVPIDACRNEIFYDVQDILRNELTFYSITSQKKEAKSDVSGAKGNSSGSNIVVISSPRKVHGGNLENYGDEDSDGYEITGEYDLAKASAATNANCNNNVNRDYEDNLIKLAEQLSYEDDDDDDNDNDDNDEEDDDDDELEGTYKVMADEVETVRNTSTAGSMRLKDIVGKNETIDLSQYEKRQNEHAKSSLGGAQMMSSSSAFIELAPSEIKPYSRIGSDEDENEQDDDDSQMSDNLETAVSRQPHIITSSQSQPKFESGNNDAAEITIEDLPKNFTFTNLFEDKDGGNGDEKKSDKDCGDDLVTMENILLQSIADNIVDQNEYPGPMFGHRCNFDESNEEIDKLNSEFIKLISSHINEVSREAKQQEDNVNDNEQDDSESSGDVDEVKRIDDDRNTSEA